MNEFKPVVEFVPIEKVKPYLRNAKKHPPEQVARLAQQIASFGWDVPIVVDGDYVVIKGHGRREAAISLGKREVPVIVRTDLTEAQVRMARIADNKLPEYGKQDDEMLRFEFGTLSSDVDADLSLTGFDLSEIEDIMQEDKPAEEKESSETATASQFIVTVNCVDEPQMQEIYGELVRRGLSCKLVT